MKKFFDVKIRLRHLAFLLSTLVTLFAITISSVHFHQVVTLKTERHLLNVPNATESQHECLLCNFALNQLWTSAQSLKFAINDNYIIIHISFPRRNELLKSLLPIRAPPLA